MNNYLKYLQSIQTPVNFNRKVAYLKHNFSKIFSSNSQSVLEIGPGLGELVYYLNTLGYKKIDVADQDKNILKYINRKYKIRNTIYCDITKTKLKNNYDIIFLLQVFEHIPVSKYKLLVNTLFKHLNKNGKIIITVPNGGNPFSLVERYSDLTHTALFTDNSLKQIPNYCDLPITTKSTIQTFKIPPTNLINIIRIIFQKILHFMIVLLSIVNGGVYSKILTPNITLIIEKTR